METYNGHVRAPADAIILFEACRLGLLPRVQRRLSEKERQSIKSGSVFVWDEREAGMRRWTDGKSWSASRVSGSFLTYREMEGKRGGGGFAPPLAAAAAARAGKTPESTRGSDSDVELPQEEGPDGYRYKPDGLMKQSFSITTSSGNHLHLISYYSRTHPNAQALNNPTSDPALRHIRPQKGMYPESTVQEQQNIPAVTRAPMASAPYSTVPQMAGYARGPPGPPPRDYAPAGYAWAPQPPMVSPQIPYGYHYPQTQPPTNGNSPLSYSHHLPPTHPQGPSGPPPSHYDHPSAPRPDYRPPPPLHHRTSSSGNGMPQYSQHNSPHLSHPPVSHSPTSQPPAHPQQVVAQSQHRPPSSTPPLSKIDPRLMVPSPLAQQPSHPPIHSRSPSPMPPRHESSNSTPTQVTGASSIPSIGSLMNGANGTNGEAQNEAVNRSASRSPGGTRKSEGPKDIPGDKMGFVEDKRALRVLDRAFRT
ncbi:MAG: hypothetical protein LQ350_001023 [Teloschistes chrysophthalmus]|nr:MAG: hypothetical protein LQ350_001023 [Niorma chrysophthalma]